MCRRMLRWSVTRRTQRRRRVPVPMQSPIARSTPLLERLRQSSARGPAVVAHRGDSRHCPENTLAAFAAAIDAGAGLIEFDVQATADGALVCLHDAVLDRTTDAARVIGPGALVAQRTLLEVQQLDAGSWHRLPRPGERVPTLAAALAVMLPRCVPMIEHKAGTAAAFAGLLQQLGAASLVLVQSFDWDFVAEVRRLAPDLTVGLLGPNARAGRLDGAVLEHAATVGASFLHWDAEALAVDEVAAARAAGFWICSYTTDSDLGLLGGAALGLDAMCTNDPGHMQAMQTRGLLARR